MTREPMLGRHRHTCPIGWAVRTTRRMSVIAGILERLADGPVLGDGGYLLELEKRGLRAGRARSRPRW